MLDSSSKFNIPLHLEVVITLKKTRYEAVCLAFPDIKVYGESREDALAKLSRSISNFIAKQTQKTLSELFTSSNYTEVVLDSCDKENKGKQHQIFSLNDQQQKTFQQIMLKFKPVQYVQVKEGGVLPFNLLENLIEELESTFGSEDLISIQSLFPQASSSKPISQKNDGFLLGFSICLN